MRPSQPPTPTPTRASAPAADAIQRAFDVVEASAILLTNVLGNVERLVTGIVEDAAVVAVESEALSVAVAEGAATVSAAVRATPRFSRVVSELLRLVVAYRVHELKARVMAPAAGSQALQRLHERSAARLYELCIELRGGVLKVGQFASSRMDLLPAPYIEQLSRLQDRVPPIPIEPIAARVEQELGAPLEQLFSRFEPEPLAAASLAQVHTAAPADDPDGCLYAVKVQVPGIEEIVEIDLAALKVMAGVLEDRLLPHLDFRTVAEELERSVLVELDYRREARVAAELSSHFEADPSVRIPRVIEALSSDRVLTMERIEGQPLVARLEALEAADTDEARAELDRIFEILLRATCAQVLEHGLFQADPHPGNYLVVTAEDGPVLALLDFGSFTRFPDELRGAYASLAAAILARDHEQVAKRLRSLGFRTRDGADDTLVRFAEMLMDMFRPDPSVSLSDLDPRVAFEEALALAKANPVQVPHHFVLLGRVFAALGGLLLRFRPRLNLFVLLAPYLAAMSPV